MKIIIPSFAFLFVTAMTFAQEESPAPTESTAPATEEKASATVETTPEVTPSEATAPAAQKKEEVMTPAPAPAKAAKKEATATTAKPATAAAAPGASNANMSGKNMSVKDMENAWEAAIPKHDFATVEGFVAADFTGVSSKGKFVNRSEMLSEYKGDKDTYKSAKNEKLNVKMYGPNVAVVTGRAREVGSGKDGKAFDRTFLFTDTWMMRGGKWQCVASQISKIKG
ncbi:MAG TPA: nuclear transport factor 2 family protein [Chthoniobacterales bacterium]|jgi:ketosteroid isomerase-like protein|nr:nuclear transport factor 2 family protein [Chthoniobacterales bacterium]